MSLRAYYFSMTDSCLYCPSTMVSVCRATVIDGELKGIAILCRKCAREERDLAIEQGCYEYPKETHWFHMHNKGEKN